MTTMRMELRMILRSGLAAGSLALLALLAVLAVWSGMREVDAQRRGRLNHKVPGVPGVAASSAPEPTSVPA